MEGDYLNYKPDGTEDRKMYIDSIEFGDREGEYIKRGDIPEICTDEIKNVIKKYYMTKKYGLPYGDHWAKTPAVIMDVIWCLDNEDALIKSRS